MGKNLIEASRSKAYVSKGENLNAEELKLGALFRIANSLENIEGPYLKLLRDVEYLRKSNQALREENQLLRNSNRGFKGSVTRLKNKLSSTDLNASAGDKI